MKSIVLSALLSFVILIIGYFIIRHRIAAAIFAAIIIIMDINLCAARYQTGKIKNGRIIFRSLNPFRKRKVIDINKINKVVVVAANIIGYLVVVSTDYGKETIRINMHISEFRKLFGNMASLGFVTEARGSAAASLH